MNKGKKFIEDVKNDVHDLDISNQPLTSSIWGKRIKDKWYKELWWWVVENKEWVIAVLVGVSIGFILAEVLINLSECN